MRTIVRFIEEEADFRKQALPIVPARYAQTVDVISKVICVLMRRIAGICLSMLYSNF